MDLMEWLHTKNIAADSDDDYCWERVCGDQSPTEFARISRENGESPREAAAAYAKWVCVEQMEGFFVSFPDDTWVSIEVAIQDEDIQALSEWIESYVGAEDQAPPAPYDAAQVAQVAQCKVADVLADVMRLRKSLVDGEGLALDLAHDAADAACGDLVTAHKWLKDCASRLG
jgi:hypothetical protein